MRQRILTVPAVDSMTDFVALAGHLGHYFAHAAPQRVVVLVAAPIRAEVETWLASPDLPAGFGENVAQRVRDLREVIQVVSWPTDIDRWAVASDLVLDWDTSRSHLQPWASLREGYRRHRTWMTIDWRNYRLGASWLAEAAKTLTTGRGFDPTARERMRTLRERLGQAEVAHLVATGPSARDALKVDLTNGVGIVCNTVVLDDELMHHVQPDVVTFADPIFHFGPSTYAEEFQRALSRQAEEHDFTVVTTERYYPLLAAHMPSLAERIIGVRQGRGSWPQNLDLATTPAVKPYPNILTMLMLPLATTLARSAHLYGFDGRDPDDEYFWRHGRSVQFDEEMRDIKRVHPGFFDIDYADYYESHVDDVRRYLDELDIHDFPVRSATPSHIPPLATRRLGSTPRPPVLERHTAALVSITPDWQDCFGHFGPFEQRLRAAAVEAGYQHVALASAALDATEPWQLPTYGERSYVGRLGTFEEETREAITALDPPAGSVLAYYTADVWHLPALAGVAADHPDLRVVANLMHAHGWLAKEMAGSGGRERALTRLLGQCLRAAEGTNLTIAADTEELARDIKVLTGLRPPIWPMIRVSPPTGVDGDPPRASASVRVVAPVHAQRAKGFPELVRLAERQRALLQRGDLSLVARFVTSGASPSARLADLAERFERAGGTLLRDHLEDAEYASLLRSADVVLVPYRLQMFRTRTSGVVLDALSTGTPVLATRGTWAGNLVEEVGAGATYRDGDVEDLMAALDRVVAHLPEYREAAERGWPRIEERFAPDRLVAFLMEQDEDAAISTATAEQLRETATAVHEVLAWKREADAERTLAGLVQDDDRLRALDQRADQLEALGRAVRWRDQQAAADERRAARREALAQQPTSSEALRYSREARAQLDELAVVLDLVDPDGTAPGRIVDVGAHRGSAFRQFLSNGWLVHAFEADEHRYAELVERYGDDDRVKLDPRAVTDESGLQRDFYVSPESTGVSGLSPFLESHAPRGTVETVAPRDVLEPGHTRVLKTDIEGFDLFALQGFDWDADTPDVVVCEFEDAKTEPLGYRTAELAQFLDDRGYQIWVSEWHPIRKYGVRHDWHRIVQWPCELSAGSWGNLVALRSHRPEADVVAAVGRRISSDGPPEVHRSAPDATGDLDQSEGAESARDEREAGPTEDVDGESPHATANVDGDPNATTGQDHEESPGTDRSEAPFPTPTMPSRSEAVRAALRGAMKVPVAGTFALVGVAVLVTVIGHVDVAVILTACALATSVAAIHVLAVRVERRLPPHESPPPPQKNPLKLR